MSSRRNLVNIEHRAWIEKDFSEMTGCFLRNCGMATKLNIVASG
ncbi:MAG: hypothetical protein ALAOOOJD_00474 [bacterium]|nr:hypothetical protein [bacterium]